MSGRAIVPIRGLSSAFLEELDRLAVGDSNDGQWWRDLLSHDDVFLAIRRDVINAYHRGASVFRIDFRHHRVSPRVHAKYLVRNVQRYAQLVRNGDFDIEPQDVLVTRYEGPETLHSILAASRRYAGQEKSGLHPLLLASPNVIDVELALPRTGYDYGLEASLPLEPNGPKQDRIDAVSLEQDDGPATARLVFHEAKAFTNPELRASPNGEPAILKQLSRYRESLTRHADALTGGYAEVCRGLLRLKHMQKHVRGNIGAMPSAPLPQLIYDIAYGEVRLILDPNVRLLIYGFDRDQRDGALAKIIARLSPTVRVYAIGRPAVNSRRAFAKT